MYMSSYNLDEAIELYKSVGPRNADFLFPWLYQVYDRTYLPSIDLKFKEDLTLDKTKLTIFDVLVDDLADNAKIRNKRLLEQAVRIPWNGSQKFDNPYLRVTKKVWQDCISSIRQYPRYDDFKDIFFFDLDQVMNSMRYSFLINTADFSNITEDKLFLNHGVMVILHCDMDLMCSPHFNYEELNKLRPILYCVQDVAHIGNMLNTYPKEIAEVDLSSPIISMGLREGLIDKSIVIKDPEFALASLESLISHFEERMNDNLNQIKNYAGDIKSIDIEDFYFRLKDVWDAFLKRPRYWETKLQRDKFPASAKVGSASDSFKWVRM